MDILAGSPPDCSPYLCGWAYLGAQITVASDDSGTQYALWNASAMGEDNGPERIYFAKSDDLGKNWTVRISWMDARESLWNIYYLSSTDSGETWSAEVDLSTYVAGYDYILPGGFNFPFGDYYELAIDDQGNTHIIWEEGINYDSPGSIWYTSCR